MKKTISINLGGMVFNLDEDAFEKLKNYLADIRLQFQSSAEADEVLQDVEYRLAEMFSKQLTAVKQSIQLNDVTDAMRVMGKPSDFSIDGDEQAKAGAEATTKNEEPVAPQSKAKRKFFRDPNDRVFAGVCSGMSQYMGINDPIWLRVIFVVLAVSTIFLWIVPIYILLWFIMPEAQTASDFLQMRGEAVNIDSIKKTREQLKQTTPGSQSRKAANQFADVFMAILKVTGKIILYSTAVLMVVVGFSLFAGAVIAGFLFTFMLLPGMSEAVQMIADSNSYVSFFAAGITLLVSVPALAILFLGIKIFKTDSFRSAKLWLSMLGLFLLGALLTSVFAYRLSKPFSKSDERTDSQVLAVNSSDTLYLHANHLQGSSDIEINSFGDFARLFEKDNRWAIPAVELDISPSENAQWYLQKEFCASGANKADAEKNLRAIEQVHLLKGDTLDMNAYLTFDKKMKYRNQHVKLHLKMPVGATVFIDKSMDNVLEDVENLNDAYNSEMQGYYWYMTANGLECNDSAFVSRPLELDGEHTESDSFETAQIFSATNFTGIETYGNIKLLIEQGKDYRVEIGGDAEDMSELEVSMKGTTLLIENADKVKLGAGGKGNQLTAVVCLPVLEYIGMHGASECQMPNANAGRLEIVADGASKINGSIRADELVIKPAGAAAVSLLGECRSVEADVAGAAMVDLLELKADKVNMHAAGTFITRVWAEKELNAELAGAGKMEYKGNAPIKKIEQAGFTKVEKVN